MSLMHLIARLFAPRPASGDNDFPKPRPAQSRPQRHFREFTVPRRLQRGGGRRAGGHDVRIRAIGGIIPPAGENIP